MPGNAPRVRITDVAARAGVSTATVSRALTGARPMSPELRQKVLRAADELGYRVNLLGRALRQQRTRAIGLLVPDLNNPFFAALAEHLSRVVEPSGIELLVASAGGNVSAELHSVQSFLGRQIESLVIIPCDEVESEQSLQTAMTQAVTVQLDRRVLSSGAFYVGCDNTHGMALIAEHVERHVHIHDQPVVFVGAEPQSSSAHERLDGFRHRFPDALRLLGDFDVRWGQDAADRLIDQGMARGTLVAAADVIALGLLGRLQARGFRIPQDFRVIGFDGVGVTPLAYPELTTVRQPVETMGSTILDLITNGASPQRGTEIRLAPTLVEAASSPAR